jgi:hypothetical protein
MMVQASHLSHLQQPTNQPTPELNKRSNADVVMKYGTHSRDLFASVASQWKLYHIKCTEDSSVLSICVDHQWW